MLGTPLADDRPKDRGKREGKEERVIDVDGTRGKACEREDYVDEERVGELGEGLLVSLPKRGEGYKETELSEM